MVLQRADLARRNYATILYAETIFDGYSEKGFTEINSENYEKFLEHCYKKANVNQKDIKYLEAYGCGVKVQDTNIGQYTSLIDMFPE